MYYTNQAVQGEITRQAQAKDNRKNTINSQLISVMQMQYQSGIYHWMHVTQKMLQRTLHENEVEISNNLRSKILKKQHPLTVKSPFVQT